jgi:hypothetical protein
MLLEHFGRLTPEVECYQVTLCFRRLPEEGNPVPKNIGLIHFLNSVLRFVFYCILLYVFFGQYIEYTKIHNVSDINFQCRLRLKCDGTR